jgi:hypothetical protein
MGGVDSARARLESKRLGKLQGESCDHLPWRAPFLRLADPTENVQPLSANVERAPRVNPEPMTSRASNLRRFAFRRPTPHTEVPPASDVEAAAASVPMSSLHMTFIIAMPHKDPPNRRQSVLSQGTSVNGGDWGRREYAIGIYHAPFREESSAESSV